MSTVRDSVISQYDNYYGSAELAEWRRLGAIDKAQNIVELCRDLKVGAVLDVGCGDGSIISQLAHSKFGAAYQGVDISSSAIAAARAKQIAADVNFATYDGSWLPFPNEQFDVAVLSHVVEHLEHPRVLLREARRVARHVVVEVPCEHTVRLPRDYVEDPVGHINFYTPTTIRRLLQTCGLVIEKQITRGCSLPVMQFNRRWSGLVQHVIRQTALAVAPRVAPSIFVYHSALLCR